MTGTTEVVCSKNRSKPNPKPKPNDRTSTETNNKPLKLTSSSSVLNSSVFTLNNLLVTKIKKLDDGYVAQNEIQFRI